MSLAHVILGLLHQEQMTGYDLKTSCFDQCIAHLWQADQAQIYRTLDKLESQGCITCTVEIQHDRPNRKVYQVTEAGKGELRRWLQSYHPLPAVRDPLLVQVHFAALLSDADLAELLQQQLIARRQKLADCQAIALPSVNDAAASRQERVQRLALELAMRREQTYIDWLEEAIAVMAN
ncbi:MAG: PadR family transcriptional regulator [Elainellaceae cyanobacterium]